MMDGQLSLRKSELFTLPDHVLSAVLDHLDAKSLCLVACTSRRWHVLLFADDDARALKRWERYAFLLFGQHPHNEEECMISDASIDSQHISAAISQKRVIDRTGPVAGSVNDSMCLYKCK